MDARLSPKLNNFELYYRLLNDKIRYARSIRVLETISKGVIVIFQHGIADYLEKEQFIFCSSY